MRAAPPIAACYSSSPAAALLLEHLADAHRAAALPAGVLAVVGALLVGLERLEAERDLALALVDPDDLGLQLLPDREVLEAGVLVAAELGGVDQPLDAAGDRDEDAEVGDLDDGAGDDLAEAGLA